MGPRLRRMKPYRPRKKRIQGMHLYKQSLHDLKHRISSDVGSLIVLYEQGDTTLIPSAQQKAKGEFLKHATEMQQIAQKLGDRFVRAVRDYLDSVDVIVHASSPWVDEAKIRNCFAMGEKLDKEISAA